MTEDEFVRGMSYLINSFGAGDCRLCIEWGDDIGVLVTENGKRKLREFYRDHIKGRSRDEWIDSLALSHDAH